ncbi:hypothetical protein [Halopiger djelfimassiliensis]|uniref:hypothetical protein n=1 Tax=Halopiger djelfimassiliensis TaxID=1293047 RepID=UPI0006780A22|nr:hypothetical protein [Halopiger djelfimassiliensis]
MYSGSRGILYTAPPESVEEDERRTETPVTDEEDGETTLSTASEPATSTAPETHDRLAADD